MYIFNITTKVDNSIAEDWLRWQKEEYIPEVLSTNYFNNFKLFYLMNQDESEGITYVLQFFADTIFNYDSYIKIFAEVHQQKTFKRWNSNFIVFTSLLKSVQ
jgi:hypothetical protein